jgi:hypothetical protein
MARGREMAHVRKEAGEASRRGKILACHFLLSSHCTIEHLYPMYSTPQAKWSGAFVVLYIDSLASVVWKGCSEKRRVHLQGVALVQFRLN